MKILYDPQIFNWQTHGGISRYFFELMNYFYTSKELNIEMPIKFSPNHYLKNAKFSSHFFIPKNFDYFIHKLGRLNISITKKYLKKQNFNVFHPTYYNPYFLDHIGKKPFVLTVYDMIHELFPEKFSADNNISELKKRTAEKATKIIAISENTKADLIRLFNIPSEKIVVTYLANSFDNVQEIGSSGIGFPARYVLYIGDRWNYKNFNLFIKAMEPILKEDKELKVISGGASPFNREENELFNQLGISGRVIHVKVTDKIIMDLYKNALCFVFPSLYEGFGIPVLEAYSCSCPLIVSNQGSLPEVAGDACEYIDPYNKESITDTIKKVIYNQDLRKSLIEKGLERIKEFSWGKTAIETQKVYESVI